MIFTPIESKNFLNEINKQTNFKFEDCSYKNDECDSLHFEINENSYFEIHLPNKENGLTEFCLTDEFREVMFFSDSFKDLIIFLNGLDIHTIALEYMDRTNIKYNLDLSLSLDEYLTEFKNKINSDYKEGQKILSLFDLLN